MNDFIHMDFDATELQFRALDAAGHTLDTDWQRARLTVDIGEAGIGGDEIARQFLARYGPANGEVRRVADNLPRAFTTLTTNGRAMAADYRDTDTTSAHAYGGLPPIQGPR